jgi:hypothetical protein
MKREKLAAVSFAAAMMLGLAASAGAVDGTIEINQATVLANGGTFPYTIAASGSYRLTGNLTVPAGVGGIVVDATPVTIDLNGFSIIGGGSSGSSQGILGNLSTTVKNGTVTGFNTGIELGTTGIVKSFRADSNSEGINTGDNSVIEGCTANSNAEGILAGNNVVIEGSTVNFSSNAGIACRSGCTISGNSVNGSPSSKSNVGINAGGATSFSTTPSATALRASLHPMQPLVTERTS